MIKFESLKKSITEKHILGLFVFIFALGLMFSIGYTQTGKVVYDVKIGIMSVDEVFTRDSELNLLLDGNITSLKISGEIIGNGTVQVYLGDKLILNSHNLEESKGITLTGFVVSDLVNHNISEFEQMNESDSENKQINEMVEEVNNSQINQINSDVVNATIEEDILVNVTINNSQETDNLINQINESLVQNETQSYNLTQNITLSDTNESLQNVSTIQTSNNTLTVNDSIIELNITTNETQEINKTIVEINQTEIISNQTIEINESVIEFNDTNVSINVSEVTNVSVNISIENISINLSENITHNLTFNITNIVNISINQTNITQVNVTGNVTNISTEVILNQTDEVVTRRVAFTNYCDETCYLANTPKDITLTIKVNGAALNLSKISYSYVEETILKTAQTLDGYNEFDSYISGKGLWILDSTLTDRINLKIGRDEKNFITFDVDKLSNVDIDMFESNDNRISSNIVFLNKSVQSPVVYLEAQDANVVLECVQYNQTCKKWIKSDIRLSKSNELYIFRPRLDGYYALSNNDKVRPKFVPTNSVYLNSDCVKCSKIAECEAKDFCPIQNKLKDKFDFVAQLDFDVYNLDEIDSAQLCAYVSYNTDQNRIHFLKYSPENYCSNIKNGNSTSSIISFATINKTKDWVCVDVKELIDESIQRQESNLFINWMGHDLSGGSFPLTCYAGITDLEECGENNPSGANDCRPYLEINYK